jgi:hypothetical protein
MMPRYAFKSKATMAVANPANDQLFLLKGTAAKCKRVSCQQRQARGDVANTSNTLEEPRCPTSNEYILRSSQLFIMGPPCSAARWTIACMICVLCLDAHTCNPTTRRRGRC